MRLGASRQADLPTPAREHAPRARRAARCDALQPVTVYVDDAVTLWRGRRWGHLMADTLEELHAFAQALGLPRRAFRNKTSGAHYDVSAALRERALVRGATAISRHGDRELVRAVIRHAKAQGAASALERCAATGGCSAPRPPGLSFVPRDAH